MTFAAALASFSFNKTCSSTADTAVDGFGVLSWGPMKPPMRLLGTTAHNALALAVVGGALCVTRLAHAEGIVDRPGYHPRYGVEVEPHLIVGWANIDTNDPIPKRIDFNNHAGFGPGLRLSIPLVDNGFISKINNNVAIGFGVDWAHYGSNADALWFPAVLQWNFFITDVITAFGEPGISLRYSGNRDHPWNLEGVFQLGAKFMFSRYVGLTVRAGYPYFSVGVSMLF